MNLGLLGISLPPQVLRGARPPTDGRLYSFVMLPNPFSRTDRQLRTKFVHTSSMFTVVATYVSIPQ